MFYTWGCLDAPYICMPPVHPYIPIHLYASLGVYTPPHVPIILCASVYSHRLLHVVGVVRGLLTCSTPPLHLPLYGGASLRFPPPLIYWLPCASVCFGDICMSYGDFSLILGFGGVPHLLGFWGASAHRVSICLFLYILVLHYVPCFYCGYDCYSSSYGGVFWAVIGFIRTVAPSLMGLTVTLDQHGVVQTPPLVLRGSGGVIGPASVPQQ